RSARSIAAFIGLTERIRKMLHLALNAFLYETLRLCEFSVQRYRIQTTEYWVRYGVSFEANAGTLHLANLVPVHHPVLEFTLRKIDDFLQSGALLKALIVRQCAKVANKFGGRCQSGFMRIEFKAPVMRDSHLA